MKLRALTILTAIISLTSFSGFGQVRLPKLISDGMILQRNAKIKIWGWASAGENVSLNFQNKNYQTVASNDGKWLITLPDMKPGGPFEMIITGKNRTKIKNILIGDVWVCSGQSNMELPMERVKEKYADIISKSENPQIRQFNVQTTYDFNEQKEDFTSGSWLAATPENVLQFSAVGYFFAKSLFDKYNVPIGLIKASVGGSPAEAWLSEDALKKFPAHYETAQKFKNKNFIDSIKTSETAINNDWYNEIWKQDKGLHEEKMWFDTSYNASAWRKMPVPGYWADYDLKGTNGVVWFRKEINVPLSMVNKPAKLLLGRIVDRDSVYVNGKFSGTIGYQYPPRRYSLPAGLLKEGKNIIVVRVINSAGRGGFVEDKPYLLSAGSDSVDLKGLWQYKLGAFADPLSPTTFFQYKPGGLFNAMISPLLKTSIKGIIWYQGESNADDPKEYQSLFPGVINDWREKWNNKELPFLYVQLANFMEAKKQPSKSNWAELREAQLKALDLPHTGIAVTIDLGEWNDIHPLNKSDVGKRLALAAQKVAYQDAKIVYSGPVYQSQKISGNKIILNFTNTGSGLMAKDGLELKEFAIAGSDKKFVWANAKIEGNKVIVWSDEVKSPVAVRYAWADNPASANLYNKEGLPASPFRTDK